jgi:DNA-binding response OmpR family regulator
MILALDRARAWAKVQGMRILLVEDEAEMAAALTSVLKRYDMVVDHVQNLAEAEEAITADVHGAVLLDRQLPDGDGLALIPKLRARAESVPIIVLTARGDLADRIAGLDGGADDYLAKPFAVEELLARLRAVLRRPAGLQSDIVRARRLAFDFGHREASVDGTPLDLPRRELLVLETLLRRMGRTVVRAGRRRLFPTDAPACPFPAISADQQSRRIAAPTQCRRNAHPRNWRCLENDSEARQKPFRWSSHVTRFHLFLSGLDVVASARRSRRAIELGAGRADHPRDHDLQRTDSKNSAPAPACSPFNC